MNPKDFDLSWNLAVSDLAAERFTVLKTTEGQSDEVRVRIRSIGGMGGREQGVENLIS